MILANGAYRIKCDQILSITFVFNFAYFSMAMIGTTYRWP